MKVMKSAWKFLKPNELVLVMAGVFFVAAIVTVVSMYRNGDAEKFNGKVRYEMLSPEKKRQVNSISEETRLGESDSNLRYAERVREANSIGLGLSLFLIRERVSNNRFLTIQQAMGEFAKSDILPPDCQVVLPDRQTDYGLMKSSRGIYYIRYSSNPLKLEILSSGYNGLEDGSTFIIRLPDTSAANLPVEANSPRTTSAGAWATIFEAPENENHYIPPPFSPVQTFTAMNWKVRALQQTELSPDRMKEINSFLQRQK